MNAEEVHFRWWNPDLEMHMYIAPDEAVGKVIVRTEVCRFDGVVTIYLKNCPKRLRKENEEA
jgi:hypothetical protein